MDLYAPSITVSENPAVRQSPRVIRSSMVPFGIALAVLAWPSALRAQRIVGTTVEPDARTPAPFVVVVVRDTGGTVVARAQSSERGTFSLALRGGGSYSLSALRVGFFPTVLPNFTVDAAEVHSVRVVLEGQRVTLAPVRVRERATCGSLGGGAASLVDAWTQARTALMAVVVQPDSQTAVRTVNYTRIHQYVPHDSVWAVIDSVRIRRGDAFRSLPVRQLLEEGFVVVQGDSIAFRAPDERVLLDEEFAGRHCFWIEPPPAANPTWLGIGIHPTDAAPRTSDIRGVMWLGRDGALTAFDFEFVGLPDALKGERAGGTIRFGRLPSGQWLVTHWSLTMPERILVRTTTGVGAYAHEVLTSVLRRTVEQGGGVTSTRRGDNQTTTLLRRDVLLRLRSSDVTPPLAGTMVRFDDDTTAYALGAVDTVRLRAVEPGIHHVSMLTAIAQDLGLAPERVRLDVLPDSGTARVDILLPTVAAIASWLCPDAGTEGGAVVVGRLWQGLQVRDVPRPLQLTASEGTADTPGYGSRALAVQRDTAGRWWACNVPHGRSYTLRSSDADSARALVRFRLRQGLGLAVVGSLRRPEREADAAAEAARWATVTLVVHVVDSATTAPLAEARVAINGSVVRTNAAGRGRAVVESAPHQRLTVTRIGYAPRDTMVDVAAGGSREVTLRLARLANTLNEVRINGRVVHAPARFADVLLRAAVGSGSLFTRDDFSGVRDLKSLLATVPGVQVNDRGVTFLRCKGESLARGGQAAPANVQVYVDGLWLNTRGDNLAEALRMVHPRDIEFVEVYDGITRIPAEFMSDACAVIAIWTRSY